MTLIIGMKFVKFLCKLNCQQFSRRFCRWNDYKLIFIRISLVRVERFDATFKITSLETITRSGAVNSTHKENITLSSLTTQRRKFMDRTIYQLSFSTQSDPISSLMVPLILIHFVCDLQNGGRAVSKQRSSENNILFAERFAVSRFNTWQYSSNPRILQEISFDTVFEEGRFVFIDRLAIST
jgi:hypothetical protein